MQGRRSNMNVAMLAAIAVMVLLLVGTFVSGGFKALTGKITQFIGGSTASNATEAGAQAGCNTICSSWSAEGCKAGTASYSKALTQCGISSTSTTRKQTLETSATAQPGKGSSYFLTGLSAGALGKETAPLLNFIGKCPVQAETAHEQTARANRFITSQIQ